MDIVEELRQDRENGAKRLESEYKAGLMSLALRFCNDSGDAEELVNRTFAAVVDGIDDYLEQSAFFGWMCQILTNIHAMDNRRKMRRLEVSDGNVSEFPDESSEGVLYKELDAAFLRDAVNELPPEIRKTVVLHYFMEMPVRDVARFLAIPFGTVAWRLKYARMLLAVKLGAAAKKPGGKALLLALALCGLAALGVAVALVGDAAFSRVRRDAASQRGGELQIAVERTDGGLESASPSSTFDFGLSAFDQPPQDNQDMNATTLRTLAASAAFSAATGAPLAAQSGTASCLGPLSYVQDGLITQFDAIDNEGNGTHNPSATVWRDLKGSASITLQGSASWADRYFDSTYETKQVIAGWPQYVRDSLTLESAMRIVKPSSSSSSLLRFIGRGSTDCFYLQNGHVYWYFGFEPASARPHSGDFNYIGTISGYSGQDEYGIAFNGTIKDKVDHRASLSWYNTDDGTGWFKGDMYLSENANGLQGHYYAIRFYNRSLSAAEIMTNAVIDKLRFFSFKYDGADANWADIAWEAPESTAATPPTAPGSSTNDYVQIVGSQVTVASSDNIGLMGLSLEDGATLNLPSGSRVAVKVLYVDGLPVPRGLYSGDGVGGVQVSWLSGSGVLAVAGATDGTFPTGTYTAPDANGYYVFGRTSANGGTTAYHSGAQKWYIRGERTDWENYWFPEGSKLKLVGYVLLKTIPAGVFSEIDLSEAEHILLCEDKAMSDGSALAIPSGVEFRYQPATSISYDGGNENYYLVSVGDSPEAGDLAMNGTLRIYGDGGGLLNSQQYTGAVSGTGTIQFGNFNKAARFSGPFTFQGTATGFNNASLLWVDSLDVDASLGDVTLNNGGNYTGNASLNANGIFFGKNGSGETANGKVNVGVLDGQARNTTLRGGGALAVWGGNTIHVGKLKSALHVVGRPQDLGCTWSWFGSASAAGNGNVEIDDADFTGNIYLSTNVNLTVGDVSGRVTFDYDTYLSDTVNATTLDITNSCNSLASVKAKNLALLPARLSGFTGSVSLTDNATKSYTVPIDILHGTNSLYNTVGCIGSGTLASAPAAGALNVTFDTTTTPAEGEYAVARFTSGGELLNGWSVTLNGAAVPSVEVGKYTVSARRDSTGIWLKVSEIQAIVIVLR